MIHNLDDIATIMTRVNHIPQVSLESFRIIVKQSVDQPKQLHYSLILSQVLVTFQQKHEVLSIASYMYKTTTTQSHHRNIGLSPLKSSVIYMHTEKH